LTFSLGCGSGSSATAGSWTSTSVVFGATGATNLISTNGATWFVTGVQLEVGSTATPFERRPFGTELALCQRYYWKTFAIGTAPAQNVASHNFIFVGGVNSDSAVKRGDIILPVVMRTDPTVVTFNPYASNSSWRVPGGSTDTVPTITATSVHIQFSIPESTLSSAHGHLTASAEL
jgi:hypothetical protein